jgi:hypothetical protein
MCHKIDSIGVAMTMNTREQANQGQQESPAGTSNQKKRAYQKPAFRHERVFETMALACGKMSATQGACHHNRKVS